MLGYDQGAHADKHDQGRDDDAVLIGRQQFLAVGIFINQAIGDEDGIVVALTKDKGCQDHIDNIELHAEEHHDSQNPDPSYRHRQECQQAQFQSSERQPQEDEHDKSTGKTDVIEVVGECACHRSVHSDEIEGEAL